ncbi:30S ribosomal protein S16 [Buchnera aphidicola]|uniref:Small ribosomal subunit protein bS16 n=1 Tax=Buchnera aphidicola subsp. Cinara cedri (strain Cc) TaxID=372461 RepID=RS16_BUCCC|nr:30S ribosomal protein S16 [Buchnera aphidicola]Q057I5.1 RecName: Full=Small ribosomal subunit protein bS16; AltName: Full=30S ribosomal protein S16 [Buchnera aphidicola BCc]ABJ90714.1 30S ribosomal protein S16 [Buchnera aphidicola BCc]
MIKIRLSRHGMKKKPFYQIIIANVRSSRNGKFIERVGFFNPFAKKNEEKIRISTKRIQYWLEKGAKKTNRIKNLLIQFKKISSNNIKI